MVSPESYKLLLLLFLLILNIILGVKSSTPIISEGVKEHKNDVAKSDSTEMFKHDSHKGEVVKNVEIDRIDKTSKDFSDVKDLAHYVDKDIKLKHIGEVGSFEGHNLKKDGAEDQHSVGFKKGHKKGHHNQGFHNSYHKDESSNKSSFFDEFTDEGDQAAFNKKHTQYDVNDGRQYQGTKTLNDEVAKNYDRVGAYDRHGGIHNQQMGHKDYGKDYHYDDRRNLNKYQKGGQHTDHGLAYGRESYHPVPAYGGYGHLPPVYEPPPPVYGPPPNEEWNYRGHNPLWRSDVDDGYYDPGNLVYDNRDYDAYIEPPTPIPLTDDAPGLPPNIVARRKQTITIYEDPRYDESASKRVDTVDPQIEVRPSRQRYEYDDTTYYAPPPVRRDGTDGVSRQSEVNKLVYNYRRQR